MGGMYLRLLDLLSAETLVTGQLLHGDAEALQPLAEVSHHLP